MRSTVFLACFALAACGGQHTPPSRQRVVTSLTHEIAAVPTHVDSAVPRDVALARFQRDSKRVTTLTGAATSRDDLVRRFTHAVESRDTATLRRLTISRAEFAYLYYPTSAQGLPPYDLSPDLMWFMQVERSNRGVSALINERSGKSLDEAGYRCLGDSTVEGRNRLWGPCVVRRVVTPGDTVEERLFGPILERDGRFKFLGYSNRL